MELLGEDSFRSSAHSRAARALESATADVAAIASQKDVKAAKAGLQAIEGVGPKIAEKLIELFTTGRVAELDELAEKVPAGLLGVMQIPGLGPKTVRAIWQTLGVTDLAGLKKALEDGSILTVPRMGEKAAEKIEASIAVMAAGHDRLRLGEAWPVAAWIVEQLRGLAGVERVEATGSLRRGKETIGDLDFLVAVKSDAAGTRVGEAFRALKGVVQVLAAGETKSSVRMRVGSELGRWDAEGGGGGKTVQCDLRVVSPEQWGAALMYFTGSKEHNVKLRQMALDRGLTLNEYGLFPHRKGDDTLDPPQKRGVKPVASATEEEIYAKLGLAWVPAEVREDRGEAELKATPRLIELGDIKAELHAHTTASDGTMLIEELAAKALERGFHTIAVTDHSQSSSIAGGLKPDRLALHVEAIHKTREAFRDRSGRERIRILAGSEVDILADGTLDYTDKVLKTLDVVVASPHAALSQEPGVATERLLAAIRHPRVHVLGHPTGRLINRRAGLAPDMAKLIAAAVEHRVALEINAHWMRLDLRDVHVRQAVAAGCLIAVDCDVHEPADYDNLRFGVMTGRRGWLTPELCVNSWDGPKLWAWLGSKK